MFVDTVCQTVIMSDMYEQILDWTEQGLRTRYDPFLIPHKYYRTTETSTLLVEFL